MGACLVNAIETADKQAIEYIKNEIDKFIKYKM